MKYKRKIPMNFDKSKFFRRCYNREPIKHFYAFLNMLEDDKKYDLQFFQQTLTDREQTHPALLCNDVLSGMIAFHHYVHDLEKEIVRLRKVAKTNSIDYKYISGAEEPPKTTNLPAKKQDRWTGLFKRLFT